MEYSSDFVCVCVFGATKCVDIMCVCIKVKIYALKIFMTKMAIVHWKQLVNIAFKTNNKSTC